MKQNTISRPITHKGIGLHSGVDITMRLRPADQSTGIVFVRTDLVKNNIIPAKWDNVVDTKLCTVIGNKNGAIVGTVEHLMSALRGASIDNIIIEVSGPELPAMDGSARLFLELIEKAGITQQNAPRHYIKILKEIVVKQDDKMASFKPAQRSVFSGAIEFNHPEIGRQNYTVELINGNFKHDIAAARTFGFYHEVEYMRKNGLALGGSLDNAIVLDDKTVMNAKGLRFADEFIRHKLLDAIGDLYLAGAPILGIYDAEKAGHAMNNNLLRALFAEHNAYEIVDATGNVVKDDAVLSIAPFIIDQDTPRKTIAA